MKKPQVNPHTLFYRKEIVMVLTVKELIDKLNQMPQDKLVFDDYCKWYGVKDVRLTDDGDVCLVWVSND